MRKISNKTCFARFIEYRDIENWPATLPANIDIDALQQATRAYIDDMSLLVPSFPVNKGTDKLMSRYERMVRASSRAFVSVCKDDANWASLYPYLNQAPALPIPSVANISQADNPTPVASPVTAEKITSEQITSQWSACLAPSYSITTAKKLGLKEKTRPNWEASGDYGHEWGSAVHELLEVCHKSSSSELPFETVVQDASGLPQLVRGVIDLIFEEPAAPTSPAGWTIVDYKTEEISESQVDSAVDYYGSQLKTYAEYWQRLTSLPIKATGLYFTKVEQYREC